MQSCRKLSNTCSIHGKNREISGTYNFWAIVKSNIPNIWNCNCWTFFGLEIELGGHNPPATSNYAPNSLNLKRYNSSKFSSSIVTKCLTFLYLITYLFLFLTYLFFNMIKEHPLKTSTFLFLITYLFSFLAYLFL